MSFLIDIDELDATRSAQSVQKEHGGSLVKTKRTLTASNLFFPFFLVEEKKERDE